MKEGETKFVIPHKDRSGTGVIYVPAHIVKDSTFPFQDGEEIALLIKNKKLVAKKASRSKESMR